MTQDLKTLMRVMLCLSCLFLPAIKGQAQQRTKQPRVNLSGAPIVSYGTAVGLRLGVQSGITGKQFMRDGNALEGILSTHINRKGVTGTILYEWHRNAFGAKNLLWFYGGGGHVGYYRYKTYYDSSTPDKNSKSGNFVEIGADGILGIEYAFSSVPFSLSLDTKPYLSFISGFTGGFDGALSIRYVF